MALIYKKGIIRNEELISLLEIAPNLLRDKYTKPLENEGFINSNKIGSKKLWSPTPKGQGVFNEMTILLNPPIEFLAKLGSNLDKHHEVLRERISDIF